MHAESEITQAPQLGRYEIDASRSTVRFHTRHRFGIGSVRGTLAIGSGWADTAESFADSAIHAEIDTASFRTGGRQRDQNMRSARFLDAARFPVISFRDAIVAQPAGRSAGRSPCGSSASRS